MANGRHARGAQHPAAQLDPGPLATRDHVVLAEDAAAPSGRRRKNSSGLGIPLSAPAQSPVILDALTADGPSGTGRRRRILDEAVAPAAAPAPTGRRRRVDEAPSAEIVDLAPRAERRAAARTAGHAAARRKSLLPAGAPSGSALIAGAAAVAVAAVGAVGAANSGSEVGASSVEMSRGSVLGLTEAASPAALALVDAASVDREQARASRERARVALADRARVAAQIKKKEAAAARAVAAATARAEQLALLARSYRLPVSGYRLTARFGERAYRWANGHTGLDFACAYGTPIRAVANGTVIFAGWDGSYGYKTVIRHADGTETWYAHQSQILVRRGTVAAGQIIGRVGSTGNSSGPHVHLEVRINNVPIDPMVWLRSKGMRP